jgi:DNA-binding NarL/FixJ family response regulator
MSAPVRVAIIEDNDVFREALEMLLGLQPGLEVVASAPDGDAAATLCREHSPDVLLMDYRLPGMDGVQATRLLLEACPEVAVVGLTASANQSEVEALFAAGAVACLTKDEPLEDIVAAIHRAAAK